MSHKKSQDFVPRAGRAGRKEAGGRSVSVRSVPKRQNRKHARRSELRKLN